MKELSLTLFGQNIWGNMPGTSTVSNRNAAVAELIWAYDADVVAFQECNPQTSRKGDVDIAQLIYDKYDEVCAPFAYMNFTPVFYKRERFLILDSGFLPYPGKNDMNSKSLTYAVLCDRESGIRFGFISTHFWWQNKDAEDNLQRIEHAKILLAGIDMLKSKYDVPVFATGDLNCGKLSDQGEEPYLYLTEYLLDIKEIAPISTDVLTHHEYPEYGEGGLYVPPADKEPKRTLDHMFATAHRCLAVDSFTVDTSDTAYLSSDHFPLIAEVRIVSED